MVCDKDCFNCKFDDCVNDEMDLDDRRKAAAREDCLKTIDQRAEELRRRAYVHSRKEWMRDYRKRYYEAHKEELLAKHREYYRRTRDERLAYQKAWDAAHRTQINASRRAKRKERDALDAL